MKCAGRRTAPGPVQFAVARSTSGRGQSRSVRRDDSGDAGNLLRVWRLAQPSCTQPGLGHMELTVSAVMANQNIGLRQDRGVAQRPWTIPVKPDLGRDKGQIFGFTFRTGHTTPQANLNPKEARRSGLPESSTVAAICSTYNENYERDRQFPVRNRKFDLILSKIHELNLRYFRSFLWLPTSRINRLPRSEIAPRRERSRNLAPRFRLRNRVHQSAIEDSNRHFDARFLRIVPGCGSRKSARVEQLSASGRFPSRAGYAARAGRWQAG